MKKYLLISLIIVAFSGISKISVAQEDLFTVLNSMLTEDQLKTIDGCVSDIKKGDDQIKLAEADDKSTAKFFESNRRRKQKKGEKKSVDAKEYRIKAARYYDRAYSTICEIYKEYYDQATFTFTADKQNADALVEESAQSINDAKNKLKPYEKLQGNQLKDKAYNSLKADMNSCSNNYKGGATKMYDALKIWLGQNDKKSQEEAREIALWNDARQKNTIASYQNYINNYSNGKYTPEARRMIEKLMAEEADKNQPKTDDPNVGLCYKIQILADKTRWTDQDLRRKIYKGTDKIEERFIDGYYKYQVGFYRKYDDAKQAKKSMKVRQSFVVCFNNGQQIHVKEAQRIEGVE